MKTLAFLTLSLVSPLFAQAYTVSTGSQTYSDLGGGTSLVLGDQDITSEINPAGFAFTYFGTTYTGFKVCDNGFLILGSSGSVTDIFPTHSTNWPGPTVAPMWLNAKTGTGLTNPPVDRIAWDFTAGVLSVEWKWLESDCASIWDPSMIRCKVTMDQNTGVIEFTYGDPTNPPGKVCLICTPLQAPAGTVSICDAGSTIIGGEAQYFVTATGQLTAYPTNRFIRFTPNTPPLGISTTSPLAPGTEGSAYSQQFSAANASGTTTWSATNLPTGFAMSTTGLLTCAAPVAGSYNFMVQVQDGAAFALKPFDLTVGIPPLTVASPAAGALPDGTEGKPYAVTFTPSGGSQPYTFSLTGGALPPGLVLQGSGDLSGAPTLIGDYNFDVTLADAALASVTRSYTLHVAPVTGSLSGSGGDGGSGCAASGFALLPPAPLLLFWRRRRER